MTCLVFRGYSEVVDKQGACKGEVGIVKSEFSCVRTKWMAPGLFALSPLRHLEKTFRAECTKTSEPRPSKNHQCLYWLSCAVKVLIKNAKSVIVRTVKGKRLITNL